MTLGLSLAISNGEIRFDIRDVFEAALDGMASDQRAEFLDSISCIDAVVENVASQILNGWTELSSHAARSFGAEPTTVLSSITREIARRSGDVAAREIAELERIAASHEKRANDYMTRFFHLRRMAQEHLSAAQLAEVEP